jgi:carboxyvinyl-carboxyphosphonate phosphorylmutase
VAPGVYNALSAKMMEQVGFELLYMTGAGISATLLGKPDVGFVTLSEMVMMAHYISEAVDVPVISDADTGYGNAINVMHCVREFERAGVAGIHLEDQVAPKRCGHLAGKQVIATEEMVGKLRAALETRQDPDFLIIARTDARSEFGVDEVIRRGNAYAAAGADMVMIDAALSREEMERYPASINAPLLITLGGYGKERTTPKVPLPELERMGYRIVLFPLAVLRAGARGEWDFGSELLRKGTQAEVDFIRRLEGHPIEDWYDFVGTRQVRKLEEKYLPPAEVQARYQRTQGYRL